MIENEARPYERGPIATTGVASSGSHDPEVSLFVIWSRAREYERQILGEVRARFEIAALHEVHWSASMVSRNFSRFYRGRPLPPYRTSLEHQKGRGPFLAAVVIDRSPRYGDRQTTGGYRRVNTNVFDTKDAVRQRIGQRFTVHSADTSHTAARELVLLFGRDPQTWLTEGDPDRADRIIQWHGDLIASSGWDSIRQLYAALGWCTIYVDLEGGDALDRSGSGDAPIRLLTPEYKEVLSIIAARPVGGFQPKWGGSYLVSVGGRETPIELRSGGDGYMDPAWAQAILDRRLLRSNGAFTPGDADMFDAVLYHTLAHQRTASAKDLARVRILASKAGILAGEALASQSGAEAVLRQRMAERNFGFTRPRDIGVYYNHALVGSPRPMRRTAFDAISRRCVRVFGVIVFAPLRRLVLGSREWLTDRVPSIRSLESVVRRGLPQRSRTNR